MIGKVEWCKPARRSYEDHLHEEVEGQPIFEMGTRLLSVDNKSVDESIHHDAVYDVDWSQYDVVIGVECPVPAVLTQKYPN